MRPPCRPSQQLWTLVAVGTAYQGHVSVATDSRGKASHLQSDGSLVQRMSTKKSLTDFKSGGRQDAFVEIDDTGLIATREAFPGHSDVDTQQSHSSEPKQQPHLMRSKRRQRSSSMLAEQAECDISKWKGVMMSCGKCKAIVGQAWGKADDPNAMFNDGPYRGMCSNYCAAQGLKCLAQQKPKSLYDCEPVWNGNCTIPGEKDGASTGTMMCECEGSDAKATAQGGDMKSTTDVKGCVMAGLFIGAVVACGAIGGYYYYHYIHASIGSRMSQQDTLASSTC